MLHHKPPYLILIVANNHILHKSTNLILSTLESLLIRSRTSFFTDELVEDLVLQNGVVLDITLSGEIRDDPKNNFEYLCIRVVEKLCQMVEEIVL